jgi:gliding motility-associated protein GldM
MNVLYLGVENPVDIMVAGVAADKTTVTVQNGTIKKVASYTYHVMPKDMGTVTIIVSVESGGKVIQAGKHEFRVKRIPDPVPMIAGMKGGIINKSVLMAQSGLTVTLESFDFDVAYEVIEYSVSVNLGGFVESVKVIGAKLTPEAKALIEKCNAGSKIYFEDIKAKGPEGQVRHMGTISLKIS